MTFNRIKDFFVSLVSPHPIRDWFLVVCAGLLLLLIETAYAGYVFYDIYSAGTVGAEDGAEARIPVTIKEIEETLALYRVRRDVFETRGFQLPELSDPAR